MTACTIHGCGSHARWLHDGRPLCRSHATTELIRTGRPGTQIPAETLAEAVDRITGDIGLAMAQRIDRMWQPGYLEPVREVPPAAPVPFGPDDIVDLLESSGIDEDGESWVEEVKLNAASEIRRLRARVAELEAGQAGPA